MNVNPFRTRRSTVLADAREGGALPPISSAILAERDARDASARSRSARETRVGVAASDASSGAWKIWIPLVLVPIGGVVGFGAATFLGLKACSRMAVALGGGLTLGAAGAAVISLTDDGRKKS